MARIKKTCNGCKAISFNGCELGFPTIKKPVDSRFHGVYTFSPDNILCPKPKTNADYAACFVAMKNLGFAAKFGGIQ